MRVQGWYEKKGVRILEGRWQDFIDSADLLGYGGFDVIYTDTFSEDYNNLRQFFEHLPDLLSNEDAVFSFFNGLGATSKHRNFFRNYVVETVLDAFFYDIYTYISGLHLGGIGLEVAWSDVDAEGVDEENRWGDSRQYFTLPIYRLPVGKMKLV